MSTNTYQWAKAEHLNCLMVDREHAPEELNTASPEDADVWAQRVDSPWALFLGNDNGLIIEGDLDEIVDRVDAIQRYVHRMRDEQQR